MLGQMALVAGGLACLIIGGEFLVRGAVALARRFRVPPLVIGLTLVGFGTSAPELVTSLQAALAGAPGIAVGNVVGSNIGNVLLILGVAAMLRPVAVDPAALRRDGTVLLAATLIAVGVLVAGQAGRLIGLTLVAFLALYVVATILIERRRTTPASNLYAAEAVSVAPGELSAAISASMALGGLAIVILGARFLVSGAVSLAEMAGISDVVIGLTIVAIGTSMPELVTAVVAVRRGEGDVAFGNVVGSNLFNILGILGITAIVSPISVPAEIASFDAWVMLAATVALVVFAATGRRVGRREAAVLLAAYTLYLGVLLAPLL